MPTYEYRCNQCGHEMEAFQKITEPALKLCPACNQEKLERLISGGGFILKGGGWYSDAYSSKKPEAKSETKPDAKPSSDKGDKSEKSDKPSSEAKPPEKTESAVKKTDSKPSEAA